MAGDFESSVKTTLNLIDQFSTALSQPVPTSISPSPQTKIPPTTEIPPLPLLSTCASTLKAQTTKLSLLAITPPFSPSATAKIFTFITTSLLPPLFTATLHVTPRDYAAFFSRETTTLVVALLRSLRVLTLLVQQRSQTPNQTPSPTSQSAITEATGKAWQDCDSLKNLADKGVGGFVVAKAEEHLSLIQDAVKELQEWDPAEEDDDEDEDDWEVALGSEDEDGDSGPSASQLPPDENQTITTDSSSQQIQQTQQSLLPILTRIPQSIHVVIQQRLKKGLPSLLSQPSILATLTTLLTTLAQISTNIDDAAGRLYAGDADGAVGAVRTAREGTEEVVRSVLRPWSGHADEDGDGVGNGNGNGEVSKEDRYVARALEWIRAEGNQREANKNDTR